MKEIITTFRHIAKEYDSISDDDIIFWIDLAKPLVSKKRFGKLYNQAVAYLAAHKMKMAGLGDTTHGTIGDSMRVASVSEGDVSVSYSGNMTATSNSDSELLMTPYGLQYVSLRKHVVVPIMSSAEA